MTYDLREALKKAGSATLELHGTLSDDRAVEHFCLEFQRVWLITSQHKYVFDATSASGSHFVLFWKNLSVTNVILPELLALIRLYTKDRRTGDAVRVDFVTTDDHTTFLKNIFKSLSAPIFDEDYAERFECASLTEREQLEQSALNELIRDTLRFHEAFLQRTVILDTYYTSALLHVPMSLCVDIRRVTMMSGYIHSSGIALYFRNIDKAAQGVFSDRLGQFLSTNEGKKFSIVPYASEFFSPFDKKSSASIRNGLDGVRLHLRKHFFEKESMLIFLNRLGKRYPEQLIIPSGIDDYSIDRKAAIGEHADKDSTIFFVTDSGITFDKTNGVVNKSKEIYIVAYAQQYFNENQLTIFKERKPGWVSSTTIPHTLSAAMVNIAHHYNDFAPNESGNTVRILDPFCGTGTILFDAAARMPKAAIIGFDNSPIAPLLIKDNLSFLSQSADSIEEKASLLRHILGDLKESRPIKLIERLSKVKLSKLPTTAEQKFAFALKLLLRELSAGAEVSLASISDASVSLLSDSGFSSELLVSFNSGEISFELRILFYIIWRSLLMNTFSVRSEARTPEAIIKLFIEEIQQCIKEFEDFQKLTSHDEIVSFGSYCERQGSYSREGSLSAQFFGWLNGDGFKVHERKGKSIDRDDIETSEVGINVFQVADSMEALAGMQKLFDIVITDPPYGFNSLSSDVDVMRDLYASMVPRLVDSLRPWGQLLIALPAFAKNGRQIPFYQTKDSIVKQIIYHVEAERRHVIKFAESVPGRGEEYALPWYWGTASTIERRILHFVVK